MATLNVRMFRNNRTTRRATLALLFTAGSAALLAACGSPSPAAAPTAPPKPTPPPAAPPQAAAPAPAPQPPAPAAPAATAQPQLQVTAPPSAAQPKSGGTLRVGIPTDLPNVDPHSNSPAAYDALWIGFDRLIYLNNKLEPQPMLAESWDVSPDFKRVAFHLRKGVQFHSGRDFTSDDVRYNLMRVRDPKIGGQFTTFSNWWTIDTPDKSTIVLTSDISRPLLFDYLENFNMIDQVTAEGPNSKTQAVGTGPFVLKEWIQGDRISLVKNPNYWQSGRPYLDAIEYKVLADAQAMVAQFESGTLDAALNPPLRDTGRLKNDPRFQALTNPLTGRYYTAGWNTRNSPLDNKLVRQALNYAMNRQRFASTVLLGLSEPITLPWISGSPAFDSAKANYFGFDLDKARSLLRQAGVTQMNLEYLLSPNFPELSDFGQIYQADLASIGVNVSIKQADSAAFFDLINTVKFGGVYAITTARANLSPGITILSTAAFNPEQNNEGFASDAYSSLARALAQETDAQKQKDLYHQINDLLVDEAFATAIATASPRLLMTSKVHGLDYTMHEGFVWTNVWLG